MEPSPSRPTATAQNPPPSRGPRAGRVVLTVGASAAVVVLAVLAWRHFHPASVSPAPKAALPSAPPVNLPPLPADVLPATPTFTIGVQGADAYEVDGKLLTLPELKQLLAAHPWTKSDEVKIAANPRRNVDLEPLTLLLKDLQIPYRLPRARANAPGPDVPTAPEPAPKN